MRALFVYLAIIGGVSGQENSRENPRENPRGNTRENSRENTRENTRDAPVDDSRISNRIVGGMDAQRGQFPWIVHWEARGFMCGGTLIHPNAFITAGHCVRYDMNTGNLLRQGDVVKWNLVNRINPEAEVRSGTVVACTRHPNYAAATRVNDIALCTITVAPSVAPTPLAQIPLVSGPLESPPSYLSIAGWGKVVDSENVDVSDILQVATLPVISTSVCNDATHYGALNLVVQASQLCAGYDAGGVDACQGDSGGPLFYRAPTTGIITVVGVTSYGEGCATPNRPGIYTRVSFFVDWIKQTFPRICEVLNCVASSAPSGLPSSAPSPTRQPSIITGKGTCFDASGQPMCGQSGRSTSNKQCFCDMYCGDVSDCCDDIGTACPSFSSPTPAGSPTKKPTFLPTPGFFPTPPPSSTPPAPSPAAPTPIGSRTTTCRPAGSSSPSCGIQGQVSSPPACFCDSLCSKAGDCCSDFASVCPNLASPTAPSAPSTKPSASSPSISSPTNKPSNLVPTAVGQPSCRDASGNLLCGQKGYGGNCYCDNVCRNNGDCCTDFSSLCPAQGGGGNPTPSFPTAKPTTATTPTPKVTISGSCAGIGGINFCMQKSQGQCWCDGSCTSSGDCCSDFVSVCQKAVSPTAASPTQAAGGSCIGPSGSSICNGKSSGTCWCDTVCKNAGDCCPDIVTVCGFTG